MAGPARRRRCPGCHLHLGTGPSPPPPPAAFTADGQIGRECRGGDRQVRGIEDTTADCRAPVAAGTSGASMASTAAVSNLSTPSPSPKPPRPPAPPSPPWARLEIMAWPGDRHGAGLLSIAPPRRLRHRRRCPHPACLSRRPNHSAPSEPAPPKATLFKNTSEAQRDIAGGIQESATLIGPPCSIVRPEICTFPLKTWNARRCCWRRRSLRRSLFL